MTSKSNIAITRIRTGRGDTGETVMGGKTYRKGHPLIQYSAALDMAQSHTAALPESWGDFSIRDTAQELLFRLGAVIGSRNPRQQEVAVQEIGGLMETQLDYIAGGLKALDSFLRSDPSTHALHVLRAAIRQAEVNCIAAHDHVELEARDTSEQLLYGLDFSAKALNIMSDYVFAFIWLYSTDIHGAVNKEAKWLPWDEQKIRGLN